jgi:hypothetical protein
MSRNIPDSTTKGSDSEFEFYLKSNMSNEKISQIMKTQRKSEKEIEEFLEKLQEARKRVHKLIKKFIEKIEHKYGTLDQFELMKKGVKFAVKHGFTGAEKEAFINYVMNNGNMNTKYNAYKETENTAMSKFLGVSSSQSEMLNIKATDQKILEEIFRKFNETRFIHTNIKNQSHYYRDCAPEALLGEYKADKHNISLFIHPVIVALFLPKISELENRMIFANIGRMICQRGEAYINNYNSEQVEASAYFPNELQNDYILAHEIARDPNSLAYFNDESPISNLLKRFNIQIKLWENIMNLRQGKYFSTHDYSLEDPISGFMKTINSYDWAFYDSPDLYQVQDEGTVLRKLLSVFSFRPTFIRTMSLNNSSNGAMGYSNISQLAKASFINIPILNVRLQQNPSSIISLQDALNQDDWYIENRGYVLKRRTVVYTQNIAFFYVNRKYQNVTIGESKFGCSYANIPTMSGISSINENEIEINRTIIIGSQNYVLKSLVAIKKIEFSPVRSTGSIPILNPTTSIASGCISVVIGKQDIDEEFYYYNPSICASVYKVSPDSYSYNSPITIIPEFSTSDDSEPNFTDISRSLGTIYVYVRDV